MKSQLARIALVAGVSLLGEALLPLGLPVISPAEAACDAGTVIDKSTVEEVRAKLIKAGYQTPTHLRKGCDNVWHGSAMKDGQQIAVVILPDGRIVRDGD